MAVFLSTKTLYVAILAQKHSRRRRRTGTDSRTDADTGSSTLYSAPFRVNGIVPFSLTLEPQTPDFGTLNFPHPDFVSWMGKV